LVKKIKIGLHFDKVIIKLQVASFFGTQCTLFVIIVNEPYDRWTIIVIQETAAAAAAAAHAAVAGCYMRVSCRYYIPVSSLALIILIISNRGISN